MYVLTPKLSFLLLLVTFVKEGTASSVFRRASSDPMLLNGSCNHPPTRNVPVVNVVKEHIIPVNAFGPEVEIAMRKIIIKCGQQPMTGVDVKKIHAKAMKVFEMFNAAGEAENFVFASLFRMFTSNLFETIKDTCLNEAMRLNPKYQKQLKAKVSSSITRVEKKGKKDKGKTKKKSGKK